MVYGMGVSWRNTMPVFGMISTRSSKQYTAHALRSFFAKTELSSQDLFILIDNDGALGKDDLPALPQLRLIRNDTPQSFARNANTFLALALDRDTDLFLLNNDMIFTDGWMPPLLNAPTGIVSPLCNQQTQYRLGGLNLERTVELASYLGKADLLAEIVREHQNRVHGLQRLLYVPFFCVRIAQQVCQALGALDESFGRGGAEDNDYCLRAVLAGFPVHFALSSYVLHFSGKSTWSGAESKEETTERCRLFRNVFEKKWGRPLLRLMIDYDHTVLSELPDLEQALQHGDSRAVVEILLKAGGCPVPAIALALPTLHPKP